MKKQQSDLNRRSFLKALTLGSAAGAVIAATHTVQAQEGNTGHQAKSENGYHETAHIRSYYNSLRS